MRTEDLIEALALDAPAQPAGFAGRRIGAAVLMGVAAAFVALMVWLGPRPDLAQAVRDAFFWIKLAYALSFAVAGVALVDRYGRPGGVGGRRWLLVFVPIGLLALIAVGASLGAGPAQLQRDWLGHSWTLCPLRILSLAAPVFVAALWAFQKLAPTRLRLAGFAAGLMAGGAGAGVYCLACDESAALFVLTWYTLGIFACAAIGAVVGPRLLRW